MLQKLLQKGYARPVQRLGRAEVRPAPEAQPFGLLRRQVDDRPVHAAVREQPAGEGVLTVAVEDGESAALEAEDVDLDRLGAVAGGDLERRHGVLRLVVEGAPVANDLGDRGFHIGPLEEFLIDPQLGGQRRRLG